MQNIILLSNNNQITRKIQQLVTSNGLNFIHAATIEAAFENLFIFNPEALIIESITFNSSILNLIQKIRKEYSNILSIILIVSKEQNIYEYIKLCKTLIDDIIIWNENLEFDIMFIFRLQLLIRQKAKINFILNKKIVDYIKPDVERIKQAELRKLEFQTKAPLLMNFVNSLIKAIEAKDEYTEGHSLRVAHYSMMIASKLRCHPDQIPIIYNAALLHDIGKIALDMKFLSKKRKLNKKEWKIVQQHPETGFNIIKNLDFLTDIGKDIVLHHHERWDGKGYPHQLSGGDLKPTTSIVSIADAFDAMTSYRFYRANKDKREAIDEIINNAGTQFNPFIVEKAAKALEEVKFDNEKG